MNKHPKTEWWNEAKGDNVSIWKSATWSPNEKITMGVVRPKDQIHPEQFVYILPEDVHLDYSVQLDFQRRGYDFYSLQQWATWTHDKPVVYLPNFVQYQNSQGLANLLEFHNVADAVIIHYTTLDGEHREFRFPLAGFNERYLAVLI